MPCVIGQTMDCGVPFHIESYQNKLLDNQSGRSIAFWDCHLLLVDKGYMAADEGWSLSVLNYRGASLKRQVINIASSSGCSVLSDCLLPTSLDTSIGVGEEVEDCVRCVRRKT